MTFRDDCHWCLRIGQFKKKKHTAKWPCDRFRSMEKFKLRRSVPDGGGGGHRIYVSWLVLLTTPPSSFSVFNGSNTAALPTRTIFFYFRAHEGGVVVDVRFQQPTDMLQPSIFCCVADLCFCKAAFEGQLRHYATWRLSQSKDSSWGTLLSFVASHIPRFFAYPNQNKERERIWQHHVT